MFRRSLNQDRSCSKNIVLTNKSDNTKLLLYGRRDKTSVQSNRHSSESSSQLKCPKYIENMTAIQEDLQNNNKKMNNSTSESQYLKMIRKSLIFYNITNSTLLSDFQFSKFKYEPFFVIFKHCVISDSIWSDDLITEDDLEDETDGLWFDTWEGQIELTETKRHSIDYELEDEFDIAEWRSYSPLNYIRKKSPGLLRTTSLQVATGLNQAQNNRFNHSAHTLFWNLSHDDDQDVRD